MRVIVGVVGPLELGINKGALQSIVKSIGTMKLTQVPDRACFPTVEHTVTSLSPLDSMPVF